MLYNIKSRDWWTLVLLIILTLIYVESHGRMYTKFLIYVESRGRMYTQFLIYVESRGRMYIKLKLGQIVRSYTAEVEVIVSCSNCGVTRWVF